MSWGVKIEGEDVEEWRKLPCEDRIAHKVICFGFALDLRKRRIQKLLSSGVEGSGAVNGYEEATKLF